MRGEALSVVSLLASTDLFRDRTAAVALLGSGTATTMLFKTFSSSGFTSLSKSRLKSKWETSILFRLKNMFSLKLFDIKLEFRSNGDSKALTLLDPFWLFSSAVFDDKILSMLFNFSLSFSSFCFRLKSLFSNVFCSSCVRLSLTVLVCSSCWMIFLLSSICFVKILIFSLYSSSRETLKGQEMFKCTKRNYN